MRIAAKIHIQDNAIDAHLVKYGQLVDHFLFHADQHILCHLVNGLASRQRTHHAIIHDARALMDIIKASKKGVRHLHAFAFFHLAMAHETNTQQRQRQIGAGLASLVLAAIERIYLFLQKRPAAGQRRCLDVIALPRTVIDGLWIDRCHHHWRTTRVQRAWHDGQRVKFVIVTIPGHFLARQKCLQHRQRFVKSRAGFFHRNAKPLNLVAEIATPDAQDQAPLCKDIGQHNLASENTHVADWQD